MKAAVPPCFWHSAIIESARVDLPADSAPNISTILPFGTPPIPYPKSSEIDPVGILSIFSIEPLVPSLITEPFP